MSRRDRTGMPSAGESAGSGNPAGPLAGRSVAVTRDEEPGEGLGRRLRDLGSRVLPWPAVHVTPPEDRAPLQEALAALSGYDWIVFTSPRAVAAVGAAWVGLAGGELPPALRVAAVGPATRDALAQHGWRVDRIPAAYSSGELVHAFVEAGDARDARILFPAASRARAELTDGLQDAGATVTRVEAYRTEPGLEDPERVMADISSGRVDAVTFASPSAVEGLEDGIGKDGLRRLLAEVPVAVIGPTTAGRLESYPLAALETAGEHTLDGLALAVVKLLEE